MLMSHQHLQAGDVHSVLEMMGRERMAKTMNSSAVWQITLLGSVSENVPRRRGGYRAIGESVRSKDPSFGGALAAVVIAQLIEQPLRQDQNSLLWRVCESTGASCNAIERLSREVM